MGTTYYAVRKGRRPGVYTRWADCEAQVIRFSGAVFRKFNTLAQAEQFVSGASHSTSSEPTDNESRSLVLPCEAGMAKSVEHFPHVEYCKIIAYCGGSSIFNRKQDARAGWGVYFSNPELKDSIKCGRLCGSGQTNNRAELIAVIRTIQLAPNDGRSLLIHSNSEYAMVTVTEQLPTWRKNGWCNTRGQPVANRDLIEEFDKEMNQRSPCPSLIHIPAHSSIEGNKIADKLARQGADLDA